jgi:toxin FitB
VSIVVDTNVLSELLRTRPAAQVLGWFAAQPRKALHTTAVTRAEMLLGARALAASRRKVQLDSLLEGMFANDFAGRILPFDTAAATHYADIVATRRASGRPVSQFDAQICAIARSRQMVLATRNTRDFEDCGIAVVDPWAGQRADG